MFGSDPFGSVPFGASGASVFDYDAMLASSREELVYTVALQVWNISTNTLSTLYLGSAEWATSPTDIPASTPFDGRLTTVLQFSRSVVDSARLGINFQSGDGSIVFANPDGAYDTYVDAYALGREVVVRIGRKTDAFANHLVIFRGVGVAWFADQDSVTVTIRDKGYLLEVPAQPTVYAGTGGAEGSADMKGKRKPFSYGDTAGLPLVVLNQALMIYQLTDPGFQTGMVAGTVWDRGVALTMDSSAYADYAALVAATVAAGHCIFSLSAGMVRLGAAPSGILFGTVGLAAVDSPTASDVVRYIVALATDLVAGDINQASFDTVDVAQTATMAIYVGQDESLTAADVITRVMAGVGGWAGFNRMGELSVGILTAPAGDPVAYFKRAEGDIIDISRERLPSGVWPPPWRVRVSWGDNETVFTDFAGAVTAATREYYSQPYRIATASDSGVLTDHLQAQDWPVIESCFDDVSDTLAATEATRLLTLYSAGYQLYRLTLTRSALTLDLGDAINVTFSRFGLDAGVLMRVVEISDNIQTGDGSGVDQVEILAFG